jgi:hypothetical protein
MTKFNEAEAREAAEKEFPNSPGLFGRDFSIAGYRRDAFVKGYKASWTKAQGEIANVEQCHKLVDEERCAAERKLAIAVETLENALIKIRRIWDSPATWDTNNIADDIAKELAKLRGDG